MNREAFRKQREARIVAHQKQLQTAISMLGKKTDIFIYQVTLSVRRNVEFKNQTKPTFVKWQDAIFLDDNEARLWILRKFTRWSINRPLPSKTQFVVVFFDGDVCFRVQLLRRYLDRVIPVVPSTTFEKLKTKIGRRLLK